MRRQAQKRWRIMAWLALGLLLSGPCLAGSENAGNRGNALLRIGIGARATAMGETFVGVADDVTANYWNPAGIHQMERSELAAMHAEWLADTRYEWIGFVQRLGPWLSVGVDVGYLYTGEIPRTVETGVDAYRTDGTFSYTNRVIRVAVGSRRYRRMRVGVALQVFRQQLTFAQTRNPVPSRQADSTSWTFGLLYEPPFQWMSGEMMSSLRLGASLQNVQGQAAGLIRQEDALPTVFRVGASVKLSPVPSPVEEPEKRRPGGLMLATDLILAADQPLALHGGVEYHFSNGITLRGGYRTGTGRDFLSNWTFGLGYTSGGYQLDYAVVPFGRLGTTHRVSMKLAF